MGDGEYRYHYKAYRMLGKKNGLLNYSNQEGQGSVSIEVGLDSPEEIDSILADLKKMERLQDGMFNGILKEAECYFIKMDTDLGPKQEINTTPVQAPGPPPKPLPGPVASSPEIKTINTNVDMSNMNFKTIKEYLASVGYKQNKIGFWKIIGDYFYTVQQKKDKSWTLFRTEKGERGDNIQREREYITLSWPTEFHNVLNTVDEMHKRGYPVQ